MLSTKSHPGLIQGLLSGSCRAAMLAAIMGGATTAHAQITPYAPADVQTRTSSFTYFPNGQIQTEVVEPDDLTQKLKLTTTYAYDANGNRTSSSVSGWNGTATITRASSASYGANSVNQAGLYATSVSTGSGVDQLTETREYHLWWGGLTKLVGPNGVMTQWDYDDFGRKTVERRGYATSTATTYTDRTEWSYTACGCTAIQGVTPVYVTTTKLLSSAGDKLAPISKVYYDGLNREIRSETEAIKAGVVTPVYKDTVYDTLGRVLKVSLPYFSGDPAQWTNYAYDDLGRQTSQTSPSGLVTTVTYTALQSTTTVKAAVADGGDRSRTQVSNAAGRTVAIQDEIGNWTYFLNDAKGNLTRTVDPSGNTSVLGYDLRGRKTAMADPDMGNWTYEYNAFGELTKQTDAKGQITSLYYDDAFGRLVGRQEPDLINTFVYGTAAPAKGKLVTTYTDHGYCRNHGYDSLGRPQSTNVKIGGTIPPSPYSCLKFDATALTTAVTYDAAGRVDTLTYPSGVVIKQRYNSALGFLDQVYNYTGGVAGTAYWTWQGNDALGRITDYVYGNNVATLKVYDPVKGALKSLQAGTGGVATLANVQNAGFDYDSMNRLSVRADRFDIPNLVEKVVYDKLNRLTQYGLYDSTGTTPTGTPMSVTYDSLGNIKTKSDVGIYAYNPSGVNSVRPHAVATVTGVPSTVYTYDANGNMLTGAGRTIDYTSYNMVRQVGNASTCHQFTYQGEHQRVSQAIYNLPCTSVTGASTAAATTLYMHPDAANGLSFEREIKGATTTYKHFINAGGQVVAILNTASLTGNTNASGTVNYLHYDHLGSVVAVTNSTTGAVIERRSFDPWGKPRNTTGTPGTGELPGVMNAATDRGFTLHEHLEGLGLIHMNGRVYDPTLARFVSADPYIQAPGNSQSYNRYTYGWNSPLLGADPTGYNWLSDRWHAVMHSTVGRIVVIAVVSWVTAGAATAVFADAVASAETAAFVASGETLVTGSAYYASAYAAAAGSTAGLMAGAAAGGFAGGLMASNGRIKDGAKGAITGAAFSYVGSAFDAKTNPYGNYAGHAAVGCGSAMMNGQNCGKGAASALVAKYATNYSSGLNDFQKGVVTAVSGGISSRIVGGSFENGALTATYGYLFNYCGHEGKCLSGEVMSKEEALGVTRKIYAETYPGDKLPAATKFGFEDMWLGQAKTTLFGNIRFDSNTYSSINFANVDGFHISFAHEIAHYNRSDFGDWLRDRVPMQWSSEHRALDNAAAQKAEIITKKFNEETGCCHL